MRMQPIRHTTRRTHHRRHIAKGHPPCHLCGRDIDYTAGWLDPLSFTIDHVVPLNRGGLDVRDNLAAAHRRCNRLKSDRIPAPRYATSRTW
jgi:5-methylcytosine-specific restriction endonuclease McrA